MSLHDLKLDKDHVRWNAPIADLYQAAIARGEGIGKKNGPLLINTQPHTGRLPNDRFIVEEETSRSIIAWGKVNKPFPEEKFDALCDHVCDYLGKKELFVQNCFAGADKNYRIGIQVISEKAVASMFAATMLIHDKEQAAPETFAPDFTVIHAPEFHANAEEDGTHSDAFIILNFKRRIVLIGGTSYLGEIKKSIFSVMNFLLPQKGVMTMHSSANYGDSKDDVAVFFGLSGTGKTTLSAVPERTLIGDDEHGWSDEGVFNFEGGCYAKVIRLSKETEPEIHRAVQMPLSILENVVSHSENYDVDFDDGSITENTRGTYPITHIPNMSLSGKGGHPKHIIMLTCDAFGVLPPISKLTKQQAMYHFISGYTAKVAGTEVGVVEPQATFSTCFGAPFMPLPSKVYADILGDKITEHGIQVWLINTGWSGGPYGSGKRMKLSLTRAMVTAVLSNHLKEVKTVKEPIFNLEIPVSCPGVPDNVLNPRQTWEDVNAYDQKAKELAAMFEENIRTLL